MMQTIFITGGAGFIGSHLARSHHASGDAVHILVRPGHTPLPERLVDGVSVHAVPLEDIGQMRACLRAVQPDVIYHLATDAGRHQRLPKPSDLVQLTGDLTNMLILLAVASELPAPPRVFIRTGSLAVYGEGRVPSREDQREQPVAVYTTAGVCGTHYTALLQPRLPFPALHARLALTYGPGQGTDFFIPWLIDRCQHGLPSEVRRPNDCRDLIDIADIVRGLRAMADADLEGGAILNLSTGKAPTMREVADLIVAATDVDPALVTFANDPYTDLRVSSLCGAPEKAQRLLGWHPKITLPEGIARLVAWQRRKAFA